MEKLTQKQINILQVIGGILFSGLIWLSIWFSGKTTDGLLQYLFVGVFLIAMLVPRTIERKFDLTLKLYRKALLIGLIIGIIVFVAMWLLNGTI